MKRLILLVSFLAACDDGGAEPAGDCRLEAQACAAGFRCVPLGAAWSCQPAGGPDAQVADMAPPDMTVPDMAPPDMAPPDMALPDPPDMASHAAEPAGPCSAERPCLAGECREDLPNGFCRVECEEDGDCGRQGVCNEAGLCRTRCDDAGCRAGWICDPRDEVPICVADCQEVGCSGMQICEAGLCVDPPPCVEETCNDKDDDCDDRVDEGVENACGACGPVPAEVCNEEDDDCDGTSDEGVLNACGACGRLPAEACNGGDDDCDGLTDEGVLNACGRCGNVGADVCDGLDTDCDGLIDEAAPCPGGQVCRNAVCGPPISGPGGPCQQDADCAQGACLADVPGGFCQVACARDADCGANATCVALAEGNLCLERCNGRCRAGWVCYEGDGVCFPSCQDGGCGDGYVCGADGLCAVPLVTITFSQAFIRLGLLDGTNWDGPGQAPAGALGAVAAALGAPVILQPLIDAYAGAALGAFDPPDPFGTAELSGFGAINLPTIEDTYTPSWNATWRNVALDPEADIRLRIDLTDEDLVNDDPIGSVELSSADLQAALAAGRQIAIRTDRQELGYIVAVSISVRLQ